MLFLYQNRTCSNFCKVRNIFTSERPFHLKILESEIRVILFFLDFVIDVQEGGGHYYLVVFLSLKSQHLQILILLYCKQLNILQPYKLMVLRAFIVFVLTSYEVKYTAEEKKKKETGEQKKK